MAMASFDKLTDLCDEFQLWGADHTHTESLKSSLACAKTYLRCHYAYNLKLHSNIARDFTDLIVLLSY